MVADNIKNASKYFGLGGNTAKALEHIQSFDYADVAPGRYEIGEGIFALVQEYRTIPGEDGKWEAHRKFIDIQYMLQGTERIGYAYIKNLDLQKEYDAGADCMLLSGSGGMLLMHAGMFAIFAPEDAHMPCIAAEGLQAVKKVVVKVAVTDNR